MRLEFHKDLYLPDSLLAAVRAVNFSHLFYTAHARKAAVEDRIPPHELPVSLSLADWTVVIVETFHTRPSGVLIRRPMTFNPDLHLVMAITVPVCRVKTVWVNHSRDNHRTLDRKKYVAGPLDTGR